MLKKWNKRVMTVLMHWEYCDPGKGVGGEKTAFYDPIAGLVERTDGFWYDEYISDLPLLRSKLLEFAAQTGPDLIFLNPYTDQLDPETLQKLKAKCHTCAWFGDDTWRFDNFSSHLAPNFTTVLTTDPFSVAKYRRLGIEPLLTQWAGQPVSPLKGPLPQGENFRLEVSFVGAFNQARAWFVKMLEKRGIRVECFGTGWPNGKVTAEEMERIFRESRINLNLSNSLNRDVRFVMGSPMNFARFLRSPKFAEQIKARNFEIPLFGGFQLTNYVPGIERYLSVGSEVAVYSTPDDCAQQIEYYLANEPERRAIAEAGYRRAVSGHTYTSRFSDIFRVLWGEP